MQQITLTIKSNDNSLSRGVSVWRVSVQGGLCPGGLCPGGLCPGGLCRGVSVQGVGGLCQGRRGLCPGGLHLGGLCLGGLCPGGSLLGRPPRQRPHQYSNKWAVSILLECILVTNATACTVIIKDRSIIPLRIHHCI